MNVNSTQRRAIALMTTAIALFCFSSVSGCGDAKTSDVFVFATEYRANNVKSSLATPVVDEVVRQTPERVRIHVCGPSEPPKLVQIRTELSARLSAPIEIHFRSNCESTVR
jgi:hypothetical protein